MKVSTAKKYHCFYTKQGMHPIGAENKNFEILNFKP